MNENGLTPLPQDGGSISVSPETLGQIVTELMRPVLSTMAKLLENNTAALEQLSQAQSVQNDRLEALEKQIRLQTPVTGKQAAYLNDAIRQRARELLDKRGIDDAQAVRKLGNAIRKAVLSRYGIASLRELPRHEYGVAGDQVRLWSDALTIRDITKEVRDRAMAGAEPAADPDGTERQAG